MTFQNTYTYTAFIVCMNVCGRKMVCTFNKPDRIWTWNEKKRAAAKKMTNSDIKHQHRFFFFFYFYFERKKIRMRKKQSWKMEDDVWMINETLEWNKKFGQPEILVLYFITGPCIFVVLEFLFHWTTKKMKKKKERKKEK